MPLQQFDERQILQSKAQLDSAAVPGTFTAMFSSNAYDARVDSVQIINSDSIAHNLAIAAGVGNDANVVMECQVPSRAGYDGNAPFDLLNALQPSAFHYVMLLSGDIWYWTVREAINATKVVHSFAQGGAF